MVVVVLKGSSISSPLDCTVPVTFIASAASVMLLVDEGTALPVLWPTVPATCSPPPVVAMSVIGPLSDSTPPPLATTTPPSRPAPRIEMPAPCVPTIWLPQV